MFKENSRVLALIEDKAQKAATIAGIFLAAAFSFLRKDSLQDLYRFVGSTGLVMLSAVILLMLGSVLLSAYTLRARQMLTPPSPKEILRKVDLRLSTGPDGPTDVSRENNLREQARAWNEAVKAQEQALTEKSTLLVWTQGFLVAGISTVASMLFISVFAYRVGAHSPDTPSKSISVPKETPHGKLP